MEKVVKSDYGETEVKHDNDLKSEYVENVYSVSERREPVSLVIHSMQTNMQNTNQPEDYFFEDAVKSGYDESERKQELTSIGFSDYTEDKYSVTEPTCKPVSLDDDSVQIHIKDTSLAEDYFVRKSVKSEYDEIERKQEVSSVNFKSEVFTGNKYALTEATNYPITLVTKSIQNKILNIDTFENNSIECIVKYEYDENEHQDGAASSDVRSTYTEDSVSKPTNEFTSLVDAFSNTFLINIQHSDSSEEYVVKDSVKSEYDETEFKQENSLIDSKSEVFTEENNSLIEATSGPVSLVMDVVQINTHNIDTFEKNIFEPIVKCQYDEIDHKKEISSTHFKFENTQNKYRHTVADPKNDPISLVDQNPTFQINAQDEDPSEGYNIVKVPYAIQRLDKPVSRKFSERTSPRGNLKPYQLRPTHTGSKFFSCDICSKSFSRKDHLKTHLLTHTGEKLFSCDVCSKSFSQKCHLKTHLLTHTGEKSFSCNVCSKAFSLKGDLKRHMFTHTGEKFFSCDICNKAFYSRENFKTHLLTHTGEKLFSCDVCSKSFSHKSSLKTHLLTHTGEKSFSCNVCSKAFSLKGGLKRHMFTHTGEKFLSCDVCSKSFSLKSHLKTHLLTHGVYKLFSC